MPWLSQSNLNAVHLNLTAIESAYQAVKPGMVSALGSQFAAQPDDHLRFIFANFVAYDLKPYIGSSSMSLKELMREDGLDCDNYVRLAWYLFDIMRPQSTSEICAVGWECPTFGNHAQIQIKTSGAPDLTCDPTIGLAVHGMDLSAFCTGFSLPVNCTYSIFSFNSRPNVVALDQNVRAAVTQGAYRASHLLYAVATMPKYNGLTQANVGTYPKRYG